MPEFVYSWQPLYAAALTELDAQKLKLRVYEAEAALNRKMRELESSPDGAAERQAISDAQFMLEVLLRK